MKTHESQIGEIVANTRPPKEKSERCHPAVEQIRELMLLVKKKDEDNRKINLPQVRLLKNDKSPRNKLKPHGPDRGKTWKKTGEWLQHLVIKQHPAIRELNYENRVKAEESFFYGKKKPRYREWQDEEKTLLKIRSKYQIIKRELIDQIGQPERSDFDELYPHKYDDPGLSERARRVVRDLKAVFGRDIIVH